MGEVFLAALVGPFSAAYLPISGRCLGVFVHFSFGFSADNAESFHRLAPLNDVELQARLSSNALRFLSRYFSNAMIRSSKVHLAATTFYIYMYIYMHTHYAVCICSI